MKTINIYCDGACRGNNQKDISLRIGGYGVLLIDFENKKKKEIKYACRAVTNNIMELTSVIVGLKMLKEPTNVIITSDSKYVTDAFNQKWIFSWQKRGWKKSDGSIVSNKELWAELWELLQKHTYKFVWVKGHSTNIYNNRCDELANIAMDELIDSEN